MIKNLKVSRKIALIIACVAIPLLAAALFATIKGFNKDINFALQEQKGNAFQQPLQGLLESLPRHQWLVEALNRGDAAAKDKLAAEQLAIDRLFTDLEFVNSKYGVDLQFTEEGLAKRKRQNMDPRSVKALWGKLKQQVGTAKSEELADQHRTLISNIRTMITHAGDTSNLILDPDLDSYYLMDATLVTLPQTQDRLSLITGYAAELLRKGNLSPKESSQLAIYAALLKEADVDRIAGDVNTALGEDASFYGISETLQRNLLEPLKSYSSACQELGAALSLATPESRPSAEQVMQIGTKAATASYQLWKAAVAELDILLQKRIDSIRQTRGITLAGVALGLTLSIFIAFGISKGILQPLEDLRLTSERILSGDNTARAPVVSNDEIGALAQSFNSMVEGRIRAQTKVETENKRLQENIQDLLVVVSDASDGKLGVRARVSEGALGNVADALNLMLENVGGLIGSAKTASDKVAKAASEITTVAKELEEDEKRQTDQVGQTSSGVNDLNGQAQRVLTNCQTANQAAQNARTAAEQGAQAVKELIQGMERIRENAQANAKKIKRLGDRSMEIAGMVKIITDISAKTDMLALNASIEAARAGEQGRGFTVVAEQVRGLADRTRTLTSQIEKLVADIQLETAEAVAQMETMTQEVEGSARTAQTTGGKLENIVTASTQSSELVGQINQAASQQATRAGQMLKIVEAINQVSAEAQVKVRETRNTSEQLAKLSTDLDKRLEAFEVAKASF